MMRACLLLLPLLATPVLAADGLQAKIDQLADKVEADVIKHRRHFHKNPELGNREFETAKYIARHLKSLGLKVETGIAHTGVVAVLKGGKPGPVVALRADMDALPVTEETDVPFKSKARGNYNGQDVGVMHACGHDTHMGMLLGAAEILVGIKDELPGTVKFIFQPAEEGPPAGEAGGAKMMIEEGVLKKPKPEAIFGLHVFTDIPTGMLGYRAGGLMASVDDLKIIVRGKQTHGAAPWAGIDPIVVSSQIVTALQTIPSRQLDSTKAPVIVTIGAINGGLRWNIIPDEVTMLGTLRALDEDMRKDMQKRVTRTAQKIAESAGATAEVVFGDVYAGPVTVNDPVLTEKMLPTLQRVAGDGLIEVKPILGGEDFAYYAQEIPGLFLFLGVRPEGASREEYAQNHSPRFKVDESAMKLGVRTLVNLTVDYLQM